MSKYRLLRERLVNQGIATSTGSPPVAPPVGVSAAAASSVTGHLQIPVAATDDQLRLAHDSSYIHRATSGQLTNREVKRIGFPWSSELIERSRRSTGATINAAEAALESGIGINLAGGTHHAFSDCGEGYCVFNDSCVAARVLQASNRIQSAMIVDCDVHQGNGTAQIAAEDPSIYCFSIHNQKNFPFRKVPSDLDIGLPDGIGDAAYLELLRAGLDASLARFQPDLVFYLAGADPFQGDRLGRLALSKEGLRQRDELVIGTLRQKSIPVSIAMAGGYATMVEDIVDIHFQTVQTAIGLATV